MFRLIALAWRYLWSQPLTAALNLLLLSLGLGAISFVILVSEQVEQAVTRDLAGIDLVVGAKGSPMQIMLAGVFHLDVPTGNIPLATLELLRKQPLVARAIPLSLGDSLQGYRIVGSTPEYLDLYQAKPAVGRVWQAPLEAVLGAEAAQRSGLTVGAQFASSHGLAGQGDAHEDRRYTVVGVLARSGTVLDRLVLTGLESVWAVHEHGDEHDDDHVDAELDARREITMALVSYRGPLGAAMLPRWVNAQPGLQAAAPALETARLLRMVGAGTEVLRGFGVLLLLAAGLSVFVAMLHAVRERRNDLAMMRMLGAPPARVAGLVAAEALCLGVVATVLGLALGHGLTHGLGLILAAQQSIMVTGGWWSVREWSVPALAVLLALLSAALPAWSAFRLDVTQLLQTPR
ncbi:ABC transporter permease [Roseateles toxinivorans]|uniref:Putative ABC transport system permease protein n=1 Tax=Roseateles toxinivorans TaxID=270368 RepID=A0A4R6QUS5_9BURK|nr:ABC transporter permease [Roseateles toxinivorans]TDP74939.1 putative ABC transport system permease protein [Roseateles toxinivorans]